MKEHLKEGGVMVVNMNMHSAGEGNINDYLTDTIASVFGTVCTADVKGTTNRELFASDNPKIAEVLKSSAAELKDPQLRGAMNDVAGSLSFASGGDFILTDDKAPVELLGIQVIDGLIQTEAAYYKKILQENGIRGLAEQLL